MKRFLGLSLVIVILVVALVAGCRPLPPTSVTVPGGMAVSPAPSETTSQAPKEFGVVTDRPLTPTAELHVTGTPQDVDIETYRLEVEGLVARPLSLTYQDILAYPSVTEVVDLICPGVFSDNAEWTGVPVWRVLEAAGVSPEATKVTFEALPEPSVTDKPYFTILKLDEIKGNDGIFLAYKVNGETLPKEHGYPLRLVARDKYGSNWVKWLGRIVVQ
jgi:DMSO/TMAO reductase YedYZ molybdopterin-dependent catalytic subunit